jgi:endoglucanase
MLLLQLFKLTNITKGSSAWTRTVAVVAIFGSLTGCMEISSTPQPSPSTVQTVEASPVASTPQPKLSKGVNNPTLPADTSNRELLEQSWVIYRQQFIQEDGRVIDFQASDRSTSEGQAYAMLRAVLIDDPDTFAITLDWAEKNLKRLDAKGKAVDQLWAWKWGKDKGKWGPIDRNFASDADIDAVTALIWASRRWNRPEYLELAKIKLQDIWRFSTVAAPGGKRYLLPGPVEAFVPTPTTFYLNPSYLAPYAFRLFAQVDSKNNWLGLVESSYQVLEKSSQTSAAGLPSDWIALDAKTGVFSAIPPGSNLGSVYSFDAYRVWWRVAWDAELFKAPEAERYLRTATKNLQAQWSKSGKLLARINLQGKSTVNYEATSQYAMLYPALRLLNPEMAQQQLEKKLLPRYKQGIWDDESAYYTQNLAWLGLLPPTVISPQLLKP